MKLNQNFSEKLIFLIVTALLTGFLIPYVLKQIDEAESREQIRFETEIARQTKIIEAQAKFLDEITESLWNWRYTSIRVTFHAGDPVEERYSAAVKTYETKIWEVLNNLRNQISKSRRLVSEKGYKSLVALYDEITSLDSKLADFIRQDLSKEERVTALAKIHEALRWEMTKKLDEIIDMLAKEVRLKELHAAPNT